MRSHTAPDSTPPPTEGSTRPNARSASSTRVAEIACDVAARRLWDYIDGRLPDPSRAELDAHLAVCAACATHVAFARALRRALADAGAGRLSGASHAALRARLRVALGAARDRQAGSESPRDAEGRHA